MRREPTRNNVIDARDRFGRNGERRSEEEKRGPAGEIPLQTLEGEPTLWSRLDEESRAFFLRLRSERVPNGYQKPVQGHWKLLIQRHYTDKQLMEHIQQYSSREGSIDSGDPLDNPNGILALEELLGTAGWTRRES